MLMYITRAVTRIRMPAAIKSVSTNKFEMAWPCGDLGSNIGYIPRLDYYLQPTLRAQNLHLGTPILTTLETQMRCSLAYPEPAHLNRAYEVGQDRAHDLQAVIESFGFEAQHGGEHERHGACG